MCEKLIELLPVIVGGLIAFIPAYILFKLQVIKERKAKKREKLEEAFKEIIKIEIYIFQIKKFYTYKLRGFSEIEGLEPEEPHFKAESSREHLKMLLSLYSKDFQESIKNFDNEWNNLGLERIDFFNLMEKESKTNISIKAINAGSELMNICENMKCKINNIFENDNI
ncbi:MAG: hypothetical protein JW984_00495 [Deltaproteobacteria bacterium]|uniref:Uncharacterized protein n=1 Tax=Candidatus Zymogenus saltonus TaxID=2844893 RepID=A0A9D8K8X4_9DELT|nr:hypothetical protein [Candidatus Zymogenus saltonus]